MTRDEQDDARQAGIDAGNDAVDDVMPPSSFTRRSAGTADRRSRQARWRVSAPAAGNVAASMARRCPDPLKSWRKYLVPTAWVNRRCGGRVLGETQHRDVEGMSARIRSCRARPANAARTSFTERPRNPAVQAGFKAHMRSRAKCMPVAPQRGHPTRAKRSIFISPASSQVQARGIRQTETAAIAFATYARLPSFSAATQMRPESTPYTPNSARSRCICDTDSPEYENMPFCLTM
jgi:hypothetical protein